jgi:carboxyl-terminal processing protease
MSKNTAIALLQFAFALSTLPIQGVAHAGSSEKTLAQYWAETPMSYELLKKFLRQQNCLSSETRFVGCVEAMNTLGAHATPATMLLTAEAVDAYASRIGASVGAFGPLFLVQTKTDPSRAPLSEPAEWAAGKKLQSAWTQGLTQAFSDAVASRLDFAAIADSITRGIKPSDESAWIAAKAINSYYESAIDPHTHIDPRQQFEDLATSVGASFGGVGILTSLTIPPLSPLKTGFAMVPMEGGPAEKAGVRAGDVLSEVDGQDVSGLSIQDVSKKLRGIPGTTVQLTVLREGQSLHKTIVRGQITQENVTSKIVEDRGTRMGYIRLKSFMEGTSCQAVHRAIMKLGSEGAQALILDLRGNGGGRVDQAQCISSLFLGPNRVYVQIKNLETDITESDMTFMDAPHTQLPLAVLIDAGSASASEILAGAIQDYQRGWIAGARSFGKATVQVGGDWLLDGESVPGIQIFETKARFYQPSGRTNQLHGIEPDFAIDPKPFASDEERFAVREADYYSNALPAVGEPWKQTRLIAAWNIEKCVIRTGRAAETYAAQASQKPMKPAEADYQLLSAQDILACDPALRKPDDLKTLPRS